MLKLYSCGGGRGFRHSRTTEYARTALCRSKRRHFSEHVIGLLRFLLDVGAAFGVHRHEDGMDLIRILEDLTIKLFDKEPGAHGDLRIGERVVIGGLRCKRGRGGGHLWRERGENRPCVWRVISRSIGRFSRLFEKCEDRISE